MVGNKLRMHHNVAVYLHNIIADCCRDTLIPYRSKPESFVGMPYMFYRNRTPSGELLYKQACVFFRTVITHNHLAWHLLLHQHRVETQFQCLGPVIG